MNGRGKATHWADMLAARYAPTKEQIIGEAVQRLRDDTVVDIELIEMIRAAHGQPTLPPLEERIVAEVARLESMTVAEIVGERAEEARWLRAAIEEAAAKSATEEARIKAIYGGTSDAPGVKIHGDMSDSPEGFLVAE